MWRGPGLPNRVREYGYVHVTYFDGCRPRFGPHSSRINSVSLINAIYYTLFEGNFTYNIIQDIRRATEKPLELSTNTNRIYSTLRKNTEAGNTALPATIYLSLDTMFARNARKVWNNVLWRTPPFHLAVKFHLALKHCTHDRFEPHRHYCAATLNPNHGLLTTRWGYCCTVSRHFISYD